MEQAEYSDMLVLVLPSLLNIVDHVAHEDYRTHIQPAFKKIFSMNRPVQVSVLSGIQMVNIRKFLYIL
jgi:hypothetical protein